MSKTLPPRLQRAVVPAHVMSTLATLHVAGHQAYLVGGCVRDLLRGARPKDYDITTSAVPEVVIDLFPRTVPTGLKHGTVSVLHGKELVEVTTFRGEGDYTDGRRPDHVTFLSEIDGDLGRRDFTMNAIAFDPHRGQLVDPYGGVHDLAKKRLRCVGAADARFGEDGLRALRAVRFASVLRCDVDPETLAAIPRALGTYEKVASERVLDELRKLLKGPVPSRGLGLLRSTGLGRRVLPALVDEPEADFRLRARRVDRTPGFALRMAALFRGHPSSAEALKVPNDLRDRLRALDRLRLPLRPEPTDIQLRRFAAQATRERLHDVLVLERAELGAQQDLDGLQLLKQVRARLKHVVTVSTPLTVGELALDGNQVGSALGGKGPLVGKAMRALLEAVLDDPAKNTPEALTALLVDFKRG
jgi:tRNA nucleotidyltransferase (CCA-adding enzyme)